MTADQLRACRESEIYAANNISLLLDYIDNLECEIVRLKELCLDLIGPDSYLRVEDRP